MEKINVAICWFRRDLRIADNPALWHALNSNLPVIPLFIFDTTILDKLEQGSADKRVTFIHNALSSMEKEFIKAGSLLLNFKGNPISIFEKLVNNSSNENQINNSSNEKLINNSSNNETEILKSFNSQFEIKAVYCNSDYEPEAIERDALVKAVLAKKGIALHSFKDQVIFEKDEILKSDGTPYSIYTPYSRKWIEKLQSSPSDYLKEYKVINLAGKLLNAQALNHSQDIIDKALLSNSKSLQSNSKSLQSIKISVPTIEEIGLTRAQIDIELPYLMPQQIIKNYSDTRNFPAIEGISGISPHLRFGTISIREAVRFALNISNESLFNNTWLKELIWRDFFKMILFQFPKVQNEPFKIKYSFIEWRHNESELEAWCNGKTGYPIVDAGMRELNATGLMHNRVRMITASFLVKHLLIDWRVGEAYFAEKLLDYDLSSNNGNWQWAASTGCDAVPYFRIFNPYEQARKFDPDNRYIKKWVPEVGSKTYPAPICDHKEARERALEAYKKALS